MAAPVPVPVPVQDVFFYVLCSTGPAKDKLQRIRRASRNRNHILNDTAVWTLPVHVQQQIDERFDSDALGINVQGIHWLLRITPGGEIQGAVFDRSVLTNINPRVVDLQHNGDLQTYCILWKSKHLLWYMENLDSNSSVLLVDGYILNPAKDEPIEICVCDTPGPSFPGQRKIPVDTERFETAVYQANRANPEQQKFVQRFSDDYGPLSVVPVRSQEGTRTKTRCSRGSSSC